MAENQKSAPTLPPGNFHDAEYVRTVRVITVPKGVSRAEVLDPSYLSLHSAKIQPWDRIEAHAEDGTWYGEYLVLDTSRTWTRLKELAFIPLTDADVSQTQASEVEMREALAKFRTVHRGVHRWSIVRAVDGAVIEQGLATKEEAERKKVDYVTQNALAAQPA